MAIAPSLQLAVAVPVVPDVALDNTVTELSFSFAGVAMHKPNLLTPLSEVPLPQLTVPLQSNLQEPDWAFQTPLSQRAVALPVLDTLVESDTCWPCL
jgi:hypothetical protein